MRSLRPAWLRCGLLLLAVTARAELGEGLRWPEQHLRLSPYVDLQAVYDSNVYRVGAERERLAQEQAQSQAGAGSASRRDQIISDTALESALGMNLSQNFETLRWTLGGWGRLRRYMDVQDRNSNEYGESLNLRLGEPRTLALTLTQRYALIDQYDYVPYGGAAATPAENQAAYAGSVPRDSTELTQRAMLDFGLSVERQLRDKLGATVFYDYASTEYRDTGSFTNRALYGTSVQTFGGEVGWRVTDKSRLLFVASGGLYDSEGFSQPAQTWAVRVGADSKRTGKFTLRATAGVEHYSYAGVPLDAATGLPVVPELGTQNSTQPGAETGQTDVIRPSFDVAMNWTPTARLSANLTARSGFSAASQYANNTAADMNFSAGLTYHMTDRLSFALYGVYQTSDYLNPVPIASLSTNVAPGDTVLVDKYVRTRSVALRANYATPAPFLTAFAEARNDVAESNDPYYGYTAVRFTLGVSARY